jgi:hypothetical protein
VCGAGLVESERGGEKRRERLERDRERERCEAASVWGQ